jgi:hypothetical protein
MYYPNRWPKGELRTGGPSWVAKVLAIALGIAVVVVVVTLLAT